MNELKNFYNKFTKRNKREPKIFISGAISSRLDSYEQYFMEAEEMLRDIGFLQIYNPSVVDINISWDDAMDITGKYLNKADALYVLKDYEDSKGTKQEIYKATTMNIPIFYEIVE